MASSTAPDRLLLLDTPSLYFRAFFGVPDTIVAPDGTPANAVRGLLDMLARLIADRRPTHLVACFDADWRPAFRVAALPSYKAHRVAAPAPVVDGVPIEETPDALQLQVPAIEAFLDALGIARFGVAGYEADDVLGTLAARAMMPTDLVTGDRDLFQVVDDARSVQVLYTARGVARYEVVDEAKVTEKYGIPGRAYADFALLRGDPSDGLPGVAGVGDKTAASLITRFGSFEGLMTALDTGDPGLASGPRAKLEAARAYLAAAPVVVRVVTDMELPAHDPALPVSPVHPERLVELTDRWGADNSVNRVLAALEGTRD